MTFREKFEQEHDKNAIRRCPYVYGYEKQEDSPCANQDYKCSDCWNREMPEVVEKKLLDRPFTVGVPNDCVFKNKCHHVNKTPDLNALIERAATKKDISVTIFITGDSTHISVYPCPDPSEKKGNPVAEAYRLLVQADLRDENSLACAVSNAADLLKEALE